MADIRKVIDLYAAVDYAALTDSTSQVLQTNQFNIIRGDELLLRWHLFTLFGSNTAYNIAEGAGLEFVVALNPVAVGHQLLMYAADAAFMSGYWIEFDRSAGLVSCRLSSDTTNLIDAMSSTENKSFGAALVMTPVPTSNADHVVLWQGFCNVQNDVYRTGEGTSTIIIAPPSEDVSSSSTELASTSSSQSSSESSSSSAFTPHDLVGIQGWWSVQFPASIEEAASDPAENGDTVLNWHDQINSYVVTQSSVNARPQYNTATGPSGEGEIVFDDSVTEQRLGRDGSSFQGSDSEGTMFCLVKFNAAADQNAAIALSVDASSTFLQYCTYDNANGRLGIRYRLGSGTIEHVQATTTAVTTGVWYFVESSYNSGSGLNEIVIDGVAQALTGTNPGKWNGAVTHDRFGIGGMRIGSTDYGEDVSFAEVIYSDTYLSEVQREPLRAWIAATYAGIGVSSSSESSSSDSSSESSTSEACNNTVFLCHCDGADASTVFKDESDSQHAITAVGNAQVDTAQKKFGTGSALFDGSGDELTVPYSSDFDLLPAGEFTIACWVRPNTISGDVDLLHAGGATSGDRWIVALLGGTGGVPDEFFFAVEIASSFAIIINGTSAIPTATWTHLAITRDSSNDIRLFVNGVIETTANHTQTNSIATNGMVIGSDGNGINYYDGHMDEIMILKGQAMWTSNFTPPSAPTDCPNESSSSSSSP
jgi:hypothetical protein